MKKFVNIFLFAFILLGCKKEEAASPWIQFSVATASFPSVQSYQTISIHAGMGWTAEVVPAEAGSWLALNPASGNKGQSKMVVTALPNQLQESRTATIRFTVGANVQEILVSQAPFAPGSYYADKDCILLQKASVGNGINLIVMGDGYTMGSMAIGAGRYETDMRAGVNNFFSTYPMNFFRDHFNVWMVAAISNSAGLSTKTPSRKVDTKFECLWEGASSTGIDCNTGTVREYVKAIPAFSAFSDRDMDPLTVLLPINANVYAGTCQMWSSGFSIAMIPVGSTFKNVVVHECCGHGFAKLADEYIYSSNTAIPETAEAGYYSKSQVRAWKGFGCYENVDLTANAGQTTWKEFAAYPEKYPMVGTYEGSCTYGKEIWRPEQNSCMNNNVLYFSAPSRYAMVRRIKTLSGQDANYTVAKFMAWDLPPVYPAFSGLRSLTPQEPFVPLGRPILMDTPR